MRWTRLAAMPFLGIVFFLVFVFVAPVVYTGALHSGMPMWLSQLRHMLLPGSDLVTMLAGDKNALSPKSGSSNIGTQPYLWILMGDGLILCLIASYHSKLARSNRSTYGTARLAGRRDLQAYRGPQSPSWMLRVPMFAFRVSTSLVGAAIRVLSNTQNNVQVRRQAERAGTPSRFLLGKHNGRMIALTEKQQEEHVLMTAPTGAGKSSLEIIPNLLREQGSRSLFITDLKGELHRITAGALARHHQIWWFNVARPQISHGYNPLAYVRNAMDANMLATCWVKNTGESQNDPFWNKCAQYLICATILHIRATEPHAPFSRVCDLITGTSFDGLKKLFARTPSSEARRKAAPFLTYLEKNERLVGSVMTEIINRFQLFDSDAVRMVTATNEINFHEMVDEPTALYLTIPRSEVDLYRPLMACFTMQMFRTWEQRAERERENTLPRGIGCYMDEFANIGYIPNYGEFVSTARYLRVSLIMVIQAFSQLEELYGNHVAEIIMENAHTHLLFPGAGLRECKYYSERIGDTTVDTWTRTVKSDGAIFFPTKEESWTQSEARRRLFTPEELRTMPKGTILAVPAELPAMMLNVTSYYKDASVMQLAAMPYAVTHIHVEPPAPLPRVQHQAEDDATPTARIVDADKDAEIKADLENQEGQGGNDEHFLDE